MRWLGLLALAGCPPRVPEHLRVTPVDAQQQAENSWDDEASLIRYLVGDDPLVRAPRLPDPAEVEPVSEPIADWVREVARLERGDGQVARQLQQLEERFPGTVVVPLARGYRLRMAENQLGNLVQQEDPADRIAALLSPLQTHAAGASLAKDPLHFLGSDPEAREVRAYGDRWVLGGWLHAPDLPIQPVAEALARPQWDRLANLPIGQLLRSRDAAGDPSQGFAALEQATVLSLQRAAADRDNEQAAWADTLLDAREQYGVDDPVRLLLERANIGLTASARDDDAAGSALVAATGMRWLEVCPAPPCVGLDRTELFRAAESWGARSRASARVWQVIALKDAIDTMEVGHDTVLFPRAAVKLADALMGTGARSLDTGMLRRARGDEATWLSITRAVGGDASTDWAGARVALGRHLALACDRALEDHQTGPMKPLLERIARRATQ